MLEVSKETQNSQWMNYKAGLILQLEMQAKQLSVYPHFFWLIWGIYSLYCSATFVENVTETAEFKKKNKQTTKSKRVSTYTQSNCPEPFSIRGEKARAGSTALPTRKSLFAVKVRWNARCKSKTSHGCSDSKVFTSITWWNKMTEGLVTRNKRKISQNKFITWL